MRAIVMQQVTHFGEKKGVFRFLPVDIVEIFQSPVEPGRTVKKFSDETYRDGIRWLRRAQLHLVRYHVVNSGLILGQLPV